MDSNSQYNTIYLIGIVQSTRNEFLKWNISGMSDVMN